MSKTEHVVLKIAGAEYIDSRDDGVLIAMIVRPLNREMAEGSLSFAIAEVNANSPDLNMDGLEQRMCTQAVCDALEDCIAKISLMRRISL